MEAEQIMTSRSRKTQGSTANLYAPFHDTRLLSATEGGGCHHLAAPCVLTVGRPHSHLQERTHGLREGLAM